MPHLLPAGDVLVDELHHLARVEAVHLSQVDEEATIAVLRLAVSTALAFSLAFGAAALLAGLFYHRCVGVVSQEASEVA